MAEVQGKFVLKGDGSHALGAINSVKRATSGLSHELNTSLKDNLAEAFSVGIIVEAGAKVVEFTDEVIKGADALGVTTDNFQALRIAAREAGKDMSLFEKSFVNINKAASDAIGGDSKAKGIFAALGISDADLKHLNDVKLLQKMMQGTQNVSRHEAVSDLEGLGIRGQNANALVAIQGTLANFGDFTNKLKDSGQIADTESLANVAELKDRWDDFTDALKVGVVPALSEVIDSLTKFGRGLVQIADLAGTVLGAILANMNNFSPKGSERGVRKGFTEMVGSDMSHFGRFLTGEDSLDDVMTAGFNARVHATDIVLTNTFGKEGASSIEQVIKDELNKFAKDDADFETRSAARKKAREDAEAAKNGDANRVKTPSKVNLALDKTISGGDNNSLLKIGGLGGIDVAYRLTRLSQEANNYLATIAKNTDPNNQPNNNGDGYITGFEVQ